MLTFTVTERAKSKLLADVRDSHFDSLVPAILLGNNPVEGHGYDWMVGYYERHRIPNDLIVTISGIEIYIDPYWHSQLEGKTLDYVDGQFKVYSDS